MKLVFLVAFIIFFIMIGRKLRDADNMKQATENIFGISLLSGTIALLLVFLASVAVDRCAVKETIVVCVKPLVAMDQKVIKRDIYIQNQGNLFYYWYWKDGLKTKDGFEYAEINGIRTLDIEHPTPSLVITDTRWRNPLLREIFGRAAWDHYDNTFYVPDAYVYMLRWGEYGG